MERRDFLKLAFGVAAGASLVAVAGAASAAPLMTPASDPLKSPKPEQPDLEAKPAIATEQDIENATAEQVHWGWRRRRYWRRRYYRPRFYRRRRYWRRRRYYF